VGTQYGVQPRGEHSCAAPLCGIRQCIDALVVGALKIEPTATSKSDLLAQGDLHRLITQRMQIGSLKSPPAARSGKDENLSAALYILSSARQNRQDADALAT
jgi:hypothetical protein